MQTEEVTKDFPSHVATLCVCFVSVFFILLFSCFCLFMLIFFVLIFPVLCFFEGEKKHKAGYLGRWEDLGGIGREQSM